MWNNSLQFLVLLLLALAATPGLTQEQPDQIPQGPAEGTIYARDFQGNPRTGAVGANEVLDIVYEDIIPQDVRTYVKDSLSALDNFSLLAIAKNDIAPGKFGIRKPNQIDYDSWRRLNRAHATEIHQDRKEIRQRYLDFASGLLAMGVIWALTFFLGPERRSRRAR